MFECRSYLYASNSVLTRKAACYEAEIADLTRRARIAERALDNSIIRECGGIDDTDRLRRLAKSRIAEAEAEIDAEAER